MNFYRRILGKLSRSLILMLSFSKARLESVTGANVNGVYPFNPNVFQMLWQESESSSSSVPVRSSLQSIVTSPTDESGTRPITQMGSVTDNSAAQEVLYQRRVEEGCDLFIDPDYV